MTKGPPLGKGIDKCKASNLLLLQGGVEGESWEEGY